MGWLSEHVQMPDSSRLEWKPVFAALTDKDILLYDITPLSCEDWASPYISHPLLATRYRATMLMQCPSLTIFGQRDLLHI